MLLAFNRFVNRLLVLSRAYRDNQEIARIFTPEELQLIYKSAETFEEIVHNIRIGTIDRQQAALTQTTGKKVIKGAVER